MKITVPHGIAAIISALAAALPILQSVAPAVAPGPTGIAIAGVIGLVATAGHAVWGSVKSDVIVKVLVGGLLLTGTVYVSTQLSGCATLQSPGAQPYITAAVDVAVATAESKGISAAQINSIAKQALVADSGSAATLSAVAQLVNTQLAKLNLPAGDLAAAEVLEVALSAAIQTKIGGNANVAATQAAVADVLNAVVAATGG